MFKVILSYKEANVLGAIGHNGEVTTSYLSSKTQLPPSVVSKIVDQLAQRNLLTVTGETVKLTDDGASTQRKLDQQSRRPSTVSREIFVTDDATTGAITRPRPPSEIDQSIDAELTKLRK